MKLGADHGGSGGAVFNAAAQLVGIISCKASPKIGARDEQLQMKNKRQSAWSRRAIPMGATVVGKDRRWTISDVIKGSPAKSRLFAGDSYCAVDVADAL